MQACNAGAAGPRCSAVQPARRAAACLQELGHVPNECQVGARLVAAACGCAEKANQQVEHPSMPLHSPIHQAGLGAVHSSLQAAAAAAAAHPRRRPWCRLLRRGLQTRSARPCPGRSCSLWFLGGRADRGGGPAQARKLRAMGDARLRAPTFCHSHTPHPHSAALTSILILKPVATPAAPAAASAPHGAGKLGLLRHCCRRCRCSTAAGVPGDGAGLQRCQRLIAALRVLHSAQQAWGSRQGCGECRPAAESRQEPWRLLPDAPQQLDHGCGRARSAEER